MKAPPMTEAQRLAFGIYLRSLRVAAGLTQRVAAKLAGMSSPYLAQIERGQRLVPSARFLAGLARAYGVPEEQMLREAGLTLVGRVCFAACVATATASASANSTPRTASATMAITTNG